MNVVVVGAVRSCVGHYKSGKAYRIYQYYQYFRDICSWKLLDNLEVLMLGGICHVIQIDESVIAKQKYNVGHVISQKWILVAYDTTIKKGLIIYIINRSAVTINAGILKTVKPGNIIWTDQWNGYTKLNNVGQLQEFYRSCVWCTHKSYSKLMYISVKVKQIITIF